MTSFYQFGYNFLQSTFFALIHNYEEDSQKLEENISDQERHTLLTKSSENNSGHSNSMSSNLTIGYEDEVFSEKDMDNTRLLITTLEMTQEYSIQ